MMEPQPPSCRRTGVRRRSAWSPALASVVVLIGCSNSADPANADTEPTGADPETSQEVVTSDGGINDLSEQASKAAQELTDDALILRPSGVGQLRLGMSSKQVRETGLARALQGSRHDGWGPGCEVVLFDPEPLGGIHGGTIDGVVSPQQGLETLYATRRMVTPAGIRIGSTVDEVRAAYDRPHLEAGDLVDIPTGHASLYRIQLRRTVTSISLELGHLECGR